MRDGTPRSVAEISMSGVVTVALLLGAGGRAPATPTPPPAGCSMNGQLVVGHGLGNPPPSFIRIVTKDSKLKEVLPLPSTQSDMIQTEGLLPATQRGPTDVDCSAAVPPENGSISLSGAPCDFKHFTVTDNGPRAIFAGAARSESGAVVRVQVIQEKFFASGVFTLDDWVAFSVDGGPQIALPAKGTEPVYVTAYFPNLATGAHHIDIDTFDGFMDGGAPQGTVCL